jgi:hypothetical protein
MIIKLCDSTIVRVDACYWQLNDLAVALTFELHYCTTLIT